MTTRSRQEKVAGGGMPITIDEEPYVNSYNPFFEDELPATNKII